MGVVATGWPVQGWPVQGPPPGSHHPDQLTKRLLFRAECRRLSVCISLNPEPRLAAILANVQPDALAPGPPHLDGGDIQPVSSAVPEDFPAVTEHTRALCGSPRRPTGTFPSQRNR